MLLQYGLLKLLLKTFTFEKHFACVYKCTHTTETLILIKLWYIRTPSEFTFLIHNIFTAATCVGNAVDIWETFQV